MIFRKLCNGKRMYSTVNIMINGFLNTDAKGDKTTIKVFRIYLKVMMVNSTHWQSINYGITRYSTHTKLLV
jgi:hypothetical protein